MLNSSKKFWKILILVVFAQLGFWTAVPVSCMSARRTVRCFTLSQWNTSLGSCLLFQLVIQEQFHTPCGSTRQTLSTQPSIQGREPVTVVGGGTSTRGPWAGPANAARNEETQPDFLPALKWQYEVDKQQQN